MIIRFFCTVLFLGTLVALSFSAKAQTPPAFFDAFLFDNAGQPAENVNNFFQWTVTDGSVDLVGGNVPGADDPAMGGRLVDLGGSTNDPGRFATIPEFTFLPGMTYNLSFRYLSTDGNPNSAQAMIGSQVFTVSTASTTFQEFSQNFTFATATTARLVFQDLGSTSDGIGIDVVRLGLVVTTAANVSVSGRVTTPQGKGIRNVAVTMIDSNGNVRTAFSTSFGYYRFADVEVGQTYVLSVRAKRYNFTQSSQLLNIDDETDGINFVGVSSR